MRKIEINKKCLLELYSNNVKISDMAKYFSVSIPTIQRKVRIFKQRRIAGGQRRYFLNENYFENIDCEDKAYWLGFMLADGCVKSNSNHVVLNLSSIDESHLSKFINSLDSNYKISKQKNEGTFGMSAVTITSEKLANSLRKKGIIANNKKLFCVDKLLERHFWRGVVDGDGCIYLGYNGKCPQINISLVGMRETVHGFHKFCTEIIPSNAKIVENFQNKKIDYFGIHGSKALIICEALYQNANIYLNRKMNKYLNAKEIFIDYRMSKNIQSK